MMNDNVSTVSLALDYLNVGGKLSALETRDMLLQVMQSGYYWSEGRW